MTCYFMEFSCFLLTLFNSQIFCSRLAKYCRYSVCFIIFIKVFPNLVLLFKYYSNVYCILGVNMKRRGYGSTLSLNIKLVKFGMINK